MIDKVVNLIKSTKEIIFDQANIDIRKEKGDSDFVTLVDIKVQEHIFKGLKALFPNYQCFGEEGENNKLDLTAPTWILDPIDGTTNLIHNYQQSAVSLALWKNQCIAFGVIYNPFTDELFTASIGKGAYLNGKPIHVTSHTSMADSLISIGTTPYNKTDSKNNFLIYHKIFLDCQDIRRSGSAALDLAYVASGRIDAYFEKNLMPWDYAAGSIIVKEAGGAITTFYNDPIFFSAPCSILATNGGIHSKMLDYLKG